MAWARTGNDNDNEFHHGHLDHHHWHHKFQHHHHRLNNAAA